MTAVVTGASGHIGCVLARALVARGEVVRAVDVTRGRSLDGVDVEFVCADVTDPGAMRAALSGARVVYHLAALISIAGDPTGAVERVNVGGTEVVLRQARLAGVERVVHCSSVHAFELRAGAIDETAAPAMGADVPAYDRSKANAEQRVHVAVRDGLDVVVVNPTGVIGPFDFGPSRMGRVLRSLRAGRLPALVGGGFDWVDVRDVVAGLIAAAEHGAPGERYLLPGHRLTVAALAHAAARAGGFRAPRITVPLPVAAASARLAMAFNPQPNHERLNTPEGLAALRAHPTVDGTRAAQRLGYRTRSIDETLRDLYEWFDTGEAAAA